MASHQPPDYLIPILLSIESVTNTITKEFPNMTDKEVEWVYDQLKTYYSYLAKNKNPEEPLASTDRKQALIDEILNTLELRVEENMDSDLINNPKVAPGGNPYINHSAVYVSAFNLLNRSVRFWRKEPGKQAYLKHIRTFLNGENQKNQF